MQLDWADLSNKTQLKRKSGCEVLDEFKELFAPGGGQTPVLIEPGYWEWLLKGTSILYRLDSCPVP